MKLFRLFKVLIGIALLTTLASAGWAHNQNAERPRTNSSSAGGWQGSCGCRRPSSCKSGWRAYGSKSSCSTTREISMSAPFFQ